MDAVVAIVRRSAIGRSGSGERRVTVGGPWGPRNSMTGVFPSRRAEAGTRRRRPESLQTYEPGWFTELHGWLARDDPMGGAVGGSAAVVRGAPAGVAFDIHVLGFLWKEPSTAFGIRVRPTETLQPSGA